MSEQDDVIEMAKFASQISQELNVIDQSRTDGSRSSMANKLNPKEFIKPLLERRARQQSQQMVVAPQVNIANNIPPELAPANLQDLLIPLPDDLKGKVNTQPIAQNIPQAPIAPPKPKNQLEFGFVDEVVGGSNLPESPRDAIIFFDKKLKDMEFQLDTIKRIVIEIKNNTTKKYKKKEAENE